MNPLIYIIVLVVITVFIIVSRKDYTSKHLTLTASKDIEKKPIEKHKTDITKPSVVKYIIAESGEKEIADVIPKGDKIPQYQTLKRIKVSNALAGV